MSVVEGKNVMGKIWQELLPSKELTVGELTYSMLCRKCAMIWLPVVPVAICMLTSCVQTIQDTRVRWRGMSKNLLET